MSVRQRGTFGTAGTGDHTRPAGRQRHGGGHSPRPVPRAHANGAATLGRSDRRSGPGHLNAVLDRASVRQTEVPGLLARYSMEERQRVRTARATAATPCSRGALDYVSVPTPDGERIS